jgi:hypothetical protein
MYSGDNPVGGLMNWFKVRYIDSDSCINTVEVGSKGQVLSVMEAVEAITEALENSSIYVKDIAVLDIKRKGWFG